MAGPLESYRIVDLSSVIAGPYATQLLADQGADVIKVETHVGDVTRHALPARNGISSPFLLNNRNKRSIALDLKKDFDKGVLNRLIATADVFVQNFRPGVIERMGFGEDRVRRIKGDIIYVSISGFGESGPYVHKRVYDHVIQALSGIMDVQREGDRPVGMNTVLPDKLTAMTVAQAITAALLARASTGKGDHVRVSMLDATVAWLFPDVMIDRCFIGTDEARLTRQVLAPLVLDTQDGYVVLMIVSDDEWRGFIEASGRDDLVRDERFTTLPGRMTHRDEMVQIIRETVRTATTRVWLERLDERQVPCAAINTIDDLFSDPQIAHNRLIEEFEHPTAGRIRHARPAARFDVHVAQNRRPAPMLGEHSGEIIAEVQTVAEAVATTLPEEAVDDE